MDVLRGLGHPLGVAGEAGVVGLGLVFKAVAAALVWHLMQSSLPALTQGLMSQVV